MTGLETSLSQLVIFSKEAWVERLMELLEKMIQNRQALQLWSRLLGCENGPADITIFDAKADRFVDSHFASKA